MSKITLTDDAGNAQDVALPNGVTLTIAPAVPPQGTPPSDPPPAASSVVAACEVVINGQTVTFTDKTVSARPLASVSIGYGLGGSPKEIGAAGTATKEYPKPGTFNAALTATDDTGAKSIVLFRVVVPGTSDNTYTAGTPPPAGGKTPPADPSQHAPVASFKLVLDGLHATVTDTSTDKDGDIADVAVNWGDGEIDPDIGAGATVEHDYAQGEFTVTLSVADSTGATDKATKQAYMVPAGTPAMADFSLTVDGLNIAVTDTSTRGSSPLTTASWAWGDFPGGSPVVAAAGSMHHAFDMAGTYPVTLTVGCADGTNATVTKQVTVAGVKPAPLNIPSPDAVTVSAKFDDGTSASITINKGACVPFVAGDPMHGGCKYYGDGLCVALENMYAGTQGDVSGHFTIVAGDTTVFDGDLTLYVGAGARPFWLRQPELVANPDLSMFPALNPAPNASMWNAYHAADNSPTGYGCDISAMGTAGEHPHLGAPDPQWDCTHRANPTAQNAEVVFGMANASRVWGSHWRDIATGEMIDVTQYPKISTLSAFRGIKGNPIAPYTTNNPTQLGQAQAHATNFCAYAAVVYATEYHKEELALWSNYYSALWQNYAYRLPEGCVSAAHGIVRGKGRGLNALLYAAKYSSNPDYFDKWVRAIGKDYQTFYGAQTGIGVDHTAKSQGYPNGQFAPWQHHIQVFSLGLAVHFGYTEFQPTLDQFAGVVMDAVVSDGAAPPLQHELATVYNSGLLRSDGSFVANWRESITLAGTFNAKIESALQCAEDSQALQDAMGGGSPGNFTGHPTSPEGYAAIARQAYWAVAMYATDQVRAQAAWAKFAKYDISDYSTNPKYDLVPRAA